MKKIRSFGLGLIVISVFGFKLTLNAYDDVYSESNSYNIHQTNSNNTYIDNSQILSNNSLNFSLFSNIKKSYKAYMGGESLVYINGNYDMDSYMNRKEMVLELGVYEDIYVMYGKGKYNQKKDNDGYGSDYGYYDHISVQGDYTVTGLSYHFRIQNDAVVAFEWYESKFNKVTNSASSDYYGIEKDSIEPSELDNSTLMLRGLFYKAHTGLEIGWGIDKSGFIISFGITLRYF